MRLEGIIDKNILIESMGDVRTYDSGVPARAICRVGTTIAGDTEQNDAIIILAILG